MFKALCEALELPLRGKPFSEPCFWKMNMVPMKTRRFMQLSLYGSPGQTTITNRRVSKFCVGWRSQSANIFDLESISLGKPRNIVPWPECQPEFQVNCQNRNESKS